MVFLNLANFRSVLENVENLRKRIPIVIEALNATQLQFECACIKLNVSQPLVTLAYKMGTGSLFTCRTCNYIHTCIYVTVCVRFIYRQFFSTGLRIFKLLIFSLKICWTQHRFYFLKCWVFHLCNHIN